MKNYLRKIMFHSSVRIWSYMLVFFAYAIVTVKFSKMLGLAFDVARGTKRDYWQYAKELCIITILMMVLYTIYSMIKVQSRKVINNNLRTKLYESINKLPIDEYMKKDCDSYTSILVNDTTMIETNYITPYLCIIEEIITLLVAIVAIITMNWMCSLFVLFVSVIPLVIPKLFVGKLQSMMMSYSQENEEFLKSTSSYMEGVEVFKNYNAVSVVDSQFDKSNKELGTVKRRAYQYMDILISVIAVVSNMVILGILVFGMILALNGLLTVGEIFAITFISGSIAGPLSKISQNLPKIMGCKEIVNKLNKILNYTYKEKENVEDIIETITLDQVSLEIDNKQILNQITLDLEKNKKYAFVGTSGSGKSTLLKLILGYYNDYQGEIKINNHLLQNVSEDSLYKQITYISQNNLLLEGTVKDNITMFEPNYEKSDISSVIEFAALDNKIKEMNDGLDTWISESGVNFSGGEKQRISIARAMLKNSSFYFLDEATSALDYENYLRIEKCLMNKPNTTLVSVTHRIDKSILGKYDKIFVFHNGQICEQGHFDELYMKKGFFYELVKAQKTS
ncbi:ABC transporter ATP-binding protein [Clostridium tunisiense]|uniref:ABC transporter ATP-binding protein n=1 Tax=Clostridium tunisiense TaxID=219748 RepID=UPI0002D524E8|nr:ABC transporter ATP-binding protein [Clostridium tunisiense]